MAVKNPLIGCHGLIQLTPVFQFQGLFIQDPCGVVSGWIDILSGRQELVERLGKMTDGTFILLFERQDQAEHETGFLMRREPVGARHEYGGGFRVIACFGHGTPKRQRNSDFIGLEGGGFLEMLDGLGKLSLRRQGMAKAVMGHVILLRHLERMPI